MFEFVVCLLVSLVFLLVFRQVAKKIQLFDHANERKHHQDAIPLAGGVSVYCTLLFAETLSHSTFIYKDYFLSAAFVLVSFGFFDDKVDLSYKLRLCVQSILALFLIFFADLRISNLGAILSDATVYLPAGIDHLVTLLAIIGAINAFNMIDGLDGLLGAVSSISLAAISFEFWLNNELELASFCFVFIAAILPYIALNLSKRYKIFMGDAGSTLIGFSIVWLLIRASQNDKTAAMQTVTSLWFIAIPLMDMAGVMLRRIRLGSSPFKPGRDHIHHILLNLGFSPLRTLVIISLLAAFMAFIGILGELFNVHASIMYTLFILCFVVYSHWLNDCAGVQPQQFVRTGM